jgi:hypothetical protein
MGRPQKQWFSGRESRVSLDGGDPRQYNRVNSPAGALYVTASQKKASAAHRRRAAARGLVRVEVQALRSDAGLIREFAEALRTGSERAQTLRAALQQALTDPRVRTAFDVFGSDLGDETFAGVFDQPREQNWRESGF